MPHRHFDFNVQSLAIQLVMREKMSRILNLKRSSTFVVTQIADRDSMTRKMLSFHLNLFHTFSIYNKHPYLVSFDTFP